MTGRHRLSDGVPFDVRVGHGWLFGKDPSGGLLDDIAFEPVEAVVSHSLTRIAFVLSALKGQHLLPGRILEFFHENRHVGKSAVYAAILFVMHN
jgi:hypothetical protein